MDRKTLAQSQRPLAMAKRSRGARPRERVASHTVAVEGRLWRQPMEPAATPDG